MTAHSEAVVAVAGAAAGPTARRRLIPHSAIRIPQWGRAREILAMLATGSLVVGAVLFYVFQHIQVVRLGYEVERLRGERAALVEERKALTLEVGRLRAVRRVDELARGPLGMVTPAPGQVIVVR